MRLFLDDIAMRRYDPATFLMMSGWDVSMGAVSGLVFGRPPERATTTQLRGLDGYAMPKDRYMIRTGVRPDEFGPRRWFVVIDARRDR